MSLYSTFKSLSNLTKQKMNGTYYKNLYPDAKEILKNKDKGIFREFINICKMSQEDLKKYLEGRLKEYGYEPINGDGFLFAKGNIPVLLTAHMDTVHDELVRKFYVIKRKDGNHIITSPQGIGGDDRCGIYIVLKVLDAGFKPDILFCEDEEKGGKGSGKFIRTEYIDDLVNHKYMIELDRANSDDAVFYDCDNKEFTEYIETETGFNEAWGSFSDISNLAPVAHVAAVNLSVGYYHAHTVREEVVWEEMMKTEKIVEKLLTAIDDCKSYEYIEGYSRYSYYGGERSYYKYGYSNLTSNKGDDDKDFTKGNTSALSKPYSYDEYGWDEWEDYETVVLFVTYEDDKGGVQEGYASGETEADAWYNFFVEYKDVCYAKVLDFAYDRV